MLTPEQANKVSDDILVHERAASVRTLNARARWLPLSFYYPELKRVEPYQRVPMIRRAYAAAQYEPLTKIMSGFFVAIIVLIVVGWIRHWPLIKNLTILPLILALLYYLALRRRVRVQLRKLLPANEARNRAA